MNDNAPSRKRDPSLDAAKGLLILSVVFAHCFTEGILHDFIFSFHMPAFFVISGVTAALSKEAEKPVWKTAWKLLCTLGIPYLFFELLGVMQELIRFGFAQSWKGFLFNSATLRCNNIVDWFLGTLLLAKLLSLSIRKLLRKLLTSRRADILYAVCSFVGMITAVLYSGTAPFAIVVLRRVLIANGFLAIGLVLESVLRKKALPFGVAALAAAFVCSLLNTEFADLKELHFGLPAVFFGAALLGSYGTIQLGKITVCRPLLWLGKNSLIIMGTHIPLLLIFRYITGVTAPTIWQRAIDLILILALEIPIVWCIRRFAPFLIGQNRRFAHESKT